MEILNIYLTSDIDEEIYNNLKSLGHNIITGKQNLNLIMDNGIELIIMKASAENILFARMIRKELSIEIVFLLDHSSNQISYLDMEEIDPIGVLSIPINIYEVKINLSRITRHIKQLQIEKDHEMWFRGVLHTTKDAIIVIDDLGSITIMNTIAQHLIGIEDSKAVGMTATRVIKFKAANENHLSLYDNSTDESVEFEGEVYNRVTKNYRQVSGNITIVKDKLGKYKGKVLTLKDLGVIKDLFTRINYQSSHDNLTGILNRKSFIDYADKLITLSKYDNSTHGLLVISLDKFKVINDTCGHIAGDELLRKIAYLLNDFDNNKNLIKGRIGGDEFGILFKHSTIAQLKHFTKSIKRRITKQDFIWGEKEFPIRCSFGIVTINKNTLDHYSLFAAVDDACAISKEKGGGKIEIYDDCEDEYHKRRGEMMWIHKLKDAINKDQFILYFQDILSVKKEDTRKIEILVRIKDDDGNVISPIDFIPPAEQYGIMPDIDRIIIDKAAYYCKKIIENSGHEKKIIMSVNISATSIADKSLPSYITSIFQKYKVPPTLFCFEITETTTIKNMELAQNFIKNLKLIGCTFSLDDFGSGFSNYTYLRNMNVDYLKIDGSFISDMLDEPINKAIVESINNIGHIMKMKTVAEFVKNDEIKMVLEEIGVDYLQGYAINRPTPIENLLKKLRC